MELKRMEENGVIVPVSEHSDWVHPIVVITKKDGAVRVCLDPRNLNAALKRHHYPIPRPEELFASLSGSTVFSILDAKSAFWQLTLDEASSRLCTFTTPWGRYRFLRVPFGLATAPELFQQAIEQVFQGQVVVKPYFDDILVASSTPAEHMAHLRTVLTVARKNNLKFNKAKLKLGLSAITYLGHQLSSEGLAPDPEKVKSIEAMAVPTDKSQLQRFLGMVTYLTKFIPNFSATTSPLRELLKTDVAWHWTNRHTETFNLIKQKLSTAPVLCYYDQRKPITISTDASSYGMGSVLLQEGRPIAYASAALTAPQQRYAQIEKELLAVVFACERFHYYTFGRSVTVETDHKPLVGLQNKDLASMSPRLQRLMLRLQCYSIKLVYVPGKLLSVADALSRSPDPQSKIETADSDPGLMVSTLVQASPIKLKQIQEATDRDPTLQQLSKYIQQGWPERLSDVHPVAKPYFHIRSELYITEGFVCCGQRLAIPAALQAEVLEKLHQAHRGIVACKGLASQSVYWPSLNKDIVNLVSSCDICQSNQKSNPQQPLLDRDVPVRPWEQLAVDFFHCQGNTYILVVDYFSKYVEVKRMETTTASSVIMVLKDIFARFGIPNVLISDQGPPFDSQAFKSFLQQWDIVHEPSSPLYPSSNGQVERTIQTVKSMLIKSCSDGKDLSLVLLNYRATPTIGSSSPAELLMGRKLRTFIPTLPGNLKPHYSTESHQQLLKCRQKAQHKHGDSGTHLLPTLEKHQPVWVRHKNTWQKAVITQVGPQPRRYTVQTTDRAILVRNRVHLRPRVQKTSDATHSAEDYTLDEREPTTEPIPVPSVRDPTPPSHPGVSPPRSTYVTRTGRLIRPPARYQN
uniref:RNA-directed DNA polymerase n=1 Tax=Rhipicephalus appendiculatus TaxID=34631 RepID=A0A131YJ66_RHIAP